MSGSPKPKSSQIGRITPDGKITEFKTGISPGSKPLSIVVRDGALWFSEAAGNRVGRITVDGAVTRIPDPEPRQPAARHGHPSRRQHLVRRDRRQCARPRSTATATFTEFKVPTPNASLRGVTVGPDGDLWFTENFANKIGRMAPDGTLLGEYDIPTPASGARCIAAMSNGRLYLHAIRRRPDRRSRFSS